MAKIDIKKVIERLKAEGASSSKAAVKSVSQARPIMLGPNTRDMRQDAIDMGVHGAEYLGGSNEPGH